MRAIDLTLFVIISGWLLDMAAEFPEAKFLGLDISSDQFPAPESLPTHVSFVGGFDIYNELPEEYVGRFNVVHARLLFGAVRNYDPLPILNNFIKMLSKLKSPGIGPGRTTNAAASFRARWLSRLG